MLNLSIAENRPARSTSDLTARSAVRQRVVIVNGRPGILEMLDTLLDSGHYDVVFVESSEHAYSEIKQAQPNLVILCVCIHDLDGCQVLSMLKLDEATRDIPVLTYTTDCESRESEEDTPSVSDTGMFGLRVAGLMN